MKRTTFFSSLLTTVLGIVIASPANAGCTFTWKATATTSNWRDTGNWSSVACDHGYPVSGDIAIIVQVTTGLPPVIDDQDEVVATLTVNSGGVLTITGQMLTLDGTAQHDIDGVVNLASDASNSVLKVTGADVTMDITGQILLKASKSVLAFTADATVDGDGSIEGQHNDARIEIANSILTSSMLIQGKMSVKMDIVAASAAFVNDGTIRANQSGTLCLGASVSLSGSGNFEISTNSNAVLKFNADATGLTGNFRLCRDAKILIADGVDISTTGCLDEIAANGFLDFEAVPETGSFAHDDDTCSGGSAQSYTADTEFTGTCNS
ncbi:MAG: hypothetical protein IH984_14910 [Planctomycetes bacterium]|nr:hypothetical protein [Planctomycetota bacterium]